MLCDFQLIVSSSRFPIHRSPPCQPFTNTRHAKQRDLLDKRTAGFQSIFKVLAIIPQEDQPHWIFLENVAGFVESKARTFLHGQLKVSGYGWKEYVVSPTDIGIPNNRKRYYILAEKRSTKFPSKSTTPCFISAAEAERVVEMEDLVEYIDKDLDQSHPSWNDYVLSDEVLSQPWARDLHIVDFSRRVEPPRPWETYCFTAAYGRQLHRATGSLVFVPVKDSSPELSDREVSIKDMTQDHFVKMYSNQVRRFSPQELLRLFGFPPDFTFPPSISLPNQYKLIGNSINVSVVAKLLRELLGEQLCGSS